jgi:hypothetical protein
MKLTKFLAIGALATTLFNATEAKAGNCSIKFDKTETNIAHAKTLSVGITKTPENSDWEFVVNSMTLVRTSGANCFSSTTDTTAQLKGFPAPFKEYVKGKFYNEKEKVSKSIKSNIFYAYRHYIKSATYEIKSWKGKKSNKKIQEVLLKACVSARHPKDRNYNKIICTITDNDGYAIHSFHANSTYSTGKVDIAEKNYKNFTGKCITKWEAHGNEEIKTTFESK